MVSLIWLSTTKYTKSLEKANIDSNKGNDMTIILFYCNQMHAHYKQDERNLKHITHHYTYPVNAEKCIKLIVYNKKFKTSNLVTINKN